MEEKDKVKIIKNLINNNRKMSISEIQRCLIIIIEIVDKIEQKYIKQIKKINNNLVNILKSIK